ncbi:CBS domain-containing protein [Candidatus Micrarchaeota archaeon]|nr:CBS domain-containing protein [Candidatus Micrarchaeota archaeon]MBI5177620.1 CBS domain-containing protein [Candidatus Micrarchaeota archaeon]
MAIDISSAIVGAPVVSPGISVTKAISAMSSSPARGVIVCEGATVLGVVDARLLRDFRQDAHATKLSTVMEKVAVLSPTSPAEEAISFFLNSQARLVPVVKGGKVVGAVTRSSVASLLVGRQVVKGKAVDDFMISPALCVPEGATVAQAVGKMRDAHSYHACVLDKNGAYAGLLSSSDVAAKVTAFVREKFHEDRLPVLEAGVEKELVSTVANAHAVTVAPGSALEDAAKLMAGRGITALPVVDSAKRVRGLLTTYNLLHCCLVGKASKVEIHGLRQDEKAFGESLRELCDDFVEKLEKKIPVDLLTLHVKSVQEGGKRRYSVIGRLIVKGKLISAHTPDSDRHKAVWDAHLAAKEVLDELSREAGDIHSKLHRHGEGRKNAEEGE